MRSEKNIKWWLLNVKKRDSCLCQRLRLLPFLWDWECSEGVVLDQLK